MVNYCDNLIAIVTEWAVRQARELGIYYSGMDGCWVASVICDGCGVKYEEELGTVEARARTSQLLLCIWCDSEAE